MIDRYDDKEISNLFTLENRYNKFLDIELAVIEANVKLGKIPNSDYQLIKENLFSESILSEFFKKSSMISFDTNPLLIILK